MHVIEVPVEAGGQLRVQVTTADLPDDLELAAARPNGVLARTQQTLEQALDQIQPALRAVAERLRSMSPDEVNLEFGLTLSAETGLVVAKGSSEMHFAVTLTWNRQKSTADGA